MKPRQPLPEHLIRKMDPKQRRELGYRTNEEIKARNDTQAEKQLQGDIINLLRLRGVKWIGHSPMHKRSTMPAGTPDILFCYNGPKGPKACAIEVKVGHNTPSPEQVDAMRQMRLDGWEVLLAYSLEAVKLWLNTL